MNQDISTTCPYCGVGCGVNASSDGQQLLNVRGLSEHPANYGRLCVKGSALHETTHPLGRLTQPHLYGQPVDWDTALEAAASHFRRILAETGPESVAFYGSGQLLTEDYYVANKLMKGFIGSANLDTNSRLCMASAVASYKRALGEDAVPCCYEDLEQADLLLLVGSNAAWTHPILYQRMAAAKEARPEMKVVVIDPRRTASCDLADLHLPLASGTDVALYNGLLHFALHAGLVNTDYIAAHTEGWEACRDSVQEWTLSATAAACKIPEADLQQLFDWFAASPKTLSFYSQGINQSSSGVDKCHSILNLHLATGRIGQAGMGPFSITGQPNAMGGREVGGLSNQLAAHMDLDNPVHRERVQRFWNAPRIADKAGLKAVELFRAIESGKVRAVWIMGTNPVVSLPDADQVRRALAQCELVIVSDNMQGTDTGRFAHILFPACGWGEKNGTVTNSERRISRQRALVAPSGEAKPDWWIISQMAQRLGFGEHFAYQHPHDIFSEHARLSGFENNGERQFDISGLAQLSRDDYDALQPVQWPVNAQNPQGKLRLFEDGHFSTPSGKARFFAISLKQPQRATSSRFPYVLNTGRLRDQWHTMTRTGLAPRLLAHTDRPWLYVHPEDAQDLALAEWQLVKVESLEGQILVQARFDEGLRRGEVFVPMHWTEQFAAQARMGAVVNAYTDPISGQPESKHTPVSLEPITDANWAVLISQSPIAVEDCPYWVKVPLNEGYRYELAAPSDHDWQAWLQHKRPDHTLASYKDEHSGDQRWLAYAEAHVTAVLFSVHKPQNLPERALLERLWSQRQQDAFALISGSAGSGPDAGRTVCTCFGVGVNSIHAAIDEGCHSTKALGERLRCGTNCGSCVPELNALIQQRLSTSEVCHD